MIVGARSYNPYYFYRPYYYGPLLPLVLPVLPFSFSFGYGMAYSGVGVGYGIRYGTGYGYPYSGCRYPYYGPGYYGGLVAACAGAASAKRRSTSTATSPARVDNFDGTFQRLHLEPGEHDLELFLPGHRSFTQKIYTAARVDRSACATRWSRSAPERPSPRGPSPRRVRTQVRPEPSRDQIVQTTRGPQRTSPPARERNGNAESDFGSIALRVQPGDATVTIDGERWEGAPDQDRLVVQLGAGTHTVEIRKDGYRTYITGHHRAAAAKRLRSTCH